MSIPYDGGPAFPCQILDFQPLTGVQVVREQHSGITLRDWFASQAISCYTGSGKINAAEWAYQIADAMLVERQKGKPVTN